MLGTVRVTAPASTANLGPGFDALGLALDLVDRVEVRVLPDGVRPEVTIRGVAAGRLPADPQRLLVYRAAAALYGRIGRPAPPLAVSMDTGIPRSGGLGGSAAAIVAGLVAANELNGRPLDRDQLLDLADEIEGHPDNVAASLLGGLVVVVRGECGLVARRLDPPAELRAVLCLPFQAIATKQARGVLPVQVPMSDAVFNLGRTALLVAAFATRDWSPLREAMDDRLHQPPRGQIYGALFPTIRAALDAGAHGAALSGSGAAIIALATDHCPEIARAMSSAAAAAGFPNRSIVLALSAQGATVDA